MKCIKSCGAIVFRSNISLSDVEVLLVQCGPNHWGFPKGKMDEGESEEETALREIKEETGIEVALDTRLRLVSKYTQKSGTPREIVFFAAEPVHTAADLVPQLSELMDARWFDSAEVEPLITFPGDYKLFIEALDFWKSRR